MEKHPFDGVVFDRKRLSGPALRTFFRIAQLWQLSIDQQMILLGVGARSTLAQWKSNPTVVLQSDTLIRISHIFSIYKSLQILLPHEETADEWVRRPNTAPLFAGSSALDRMLRGQVVDLLVVRQYLEAQREA